jgi:Cu(I)/Ag(I) efflux system periplasmic protein CusF
MRFFKENLMKRLFAICAVTVSFLGAAPLATAQTVHKTTGVVTKVDKDKVTIKHEPVASMKWPSMTMAFVVKDKAVMEKMKKDQKVDFEFVQQGRDYVVTGVK